ncbi:MAG: tRNA (adenosine(37)-N6)-threonylcarbamoyltransferase complex ATPase subunit type 1 TsaE [Spirochaetia bacterium]
MICDTPKDFVCQVQQFARTHLFDRTILLYGPMGAGKTLFVKAFISGLGGNEHAVSSPTFSMMNEYVYGEHCAYHFDLYRLCDIEEFFLIGGEEVLGRQLCFVEWPQIIAPILPQQYWQVNIEILAQGARKLHITDIQSGEHIL